MVFFGAVPYCIFFLGVPGRLVQRSAFARAAAAVKPSHCKKLASASAGLARGQDVQGVTWV